MAYTDRLTDIPNRRYYEEMADTINAQPEASLPLSLCVFDIDHFKNLNDQLGHLQGDRCLRMVAQCLQAELRSNNDILARYGGEEFLLLLPNTNAAEAQLVAERIRQAVLEMNHPNPGTNAGVVTISAGISTIERSGIRIETVFKEADAALYRAKTAGRNMVCA
jgi:diguanylate cyclase (GGDEF)-like protein